MTDDTNSHEYEVGYAKPPVSGQFKPGQSGNPTGKRRPRPRTPNLFDQKFHELVEVEDNGKKVKITRLHLGIRRRVEEAAKGNLSALKELIRLRDAKEEGRLAESKPVVLSLEESLAAGPPEKSLYLPHTVIIRAPKPVDPAADGEVGYGKPPKSGRFAKGTSGNPKGRPKAEAPRTLKGLIDLELDRRVQVTDLAKGSKRRMSMREIIVTQLSNAFAAGKKGVADLILKLNQTSAAKPDYKIYVEVPWDYIIPPRAD